LYINTNCRAAGDADSHSVATVRNADSQLTVLSIAIKSRGSSADSTNVPVVGRCGR
jgi:hypothetical protein